MNGPVIRIVHGLADEESVAALVAVLCRARLPPTAAAPEPPARSPDRAPWAQDPPGAYVSPNSWQSP